MNTNGREGKVRLVRRHTKLLVEEGEAVGPFVDGLGHRFACAMSGPRFDADQDGALPGLRGLKGGSVLKAVAGDHAVVVIGSSDQHRGVVAAGLDVVQWGIDSD